MKLLVE
jgi:hypothetical protein